MIGAAADRPIFLVGAPRSGTGILAWCLGQHPNLAPLLDSGWVGGLAFALGATFRRGSRPRSQLAARGMSEHEFLVRFGPAISRTLVGEGEAEGGGEDGDEFGDGHPLFARTRWAPGTRWVDGSPENSFFIYGLQRLFPDAKFIHVVRDAGEVVGSLAGSAVPDGGYHTEASAVDLWLRTVQACVAAERAFGSATVLRIRHADLLGDPAPVIARCLSFVGEPFEPACLRPLRSAHLAVAGGTARGPRTPLPPEATALSERLLAEERPHHVEDPEARAALRHVWDRNGSGPEHGGQRGDTGAGPLRTIVRACVPARARVLVVSRGDEDLLDLGGPEAWHFPQAPDGTYAGYHPADGAAAVAHLEELRARGGEYLLFPGTSFWWLEHYHELRRYLQRRCRVVLFQDGLCLIYALSESPRAAGPDVRWSARGPAVASGKGAVRHLTRSVR